MFSPTVLNHVWTSESVFFSATVDDFDMEAALDDFVTFFIAGQETTANTMSFLLMECGRRPDVMQKYALCP